MINVRVLRVAAAAAAVWAAVAAAAPAAHTQSSPGAGGGGDVAEDAWYSVPVEALAELGVFVGTECAEGFCPDDPIDRKTMAVWLVRVLDGADPAAVSESRYDDVDAHSFFAPFIERLAELGVTEGCGGASGYCPDQTVSRAQMAVFLTRAYGLPTGADPGFSDVAGDAWYAAAVSSLAASGITGGCGDDSGFCPTRDTSRAEMATFIHRAENRAAQTALQDSTHLDSFTAISAGQDSSGYSCAIRADQTIACWGGNVWGGVYNARADVPDGRFTAVSVGHGHSCAIRADQTIACWGYNSSRQADAPDGEFTAVSAGQGHTCAVRADRTAVCWGQNYQGEADAPDGRFTAVSVGHGHSCAIRADQTIACWGDNFFGESDVPDGRFTAVSAGSDRTCAIRADRTAVCWGDNGEADVPDGRFTAISAGDNHTCAIRVDQTAVCWGSNVGLATTPFVYPYPILGPPDGRTDAPGGEFTAISAGYRHTCGITADSTAVCWGVGGAGLLSAPGGEFTAISTGSGHSCAIRADRTAVCWGANVWGQTDAPGGEFTAISAGRDYTCAIRADRTAVCWGDYNLGQADAPGGEFTAVSAGVYHSCAISTVRGTVCWGVPFWGQADAPGGEFTAVSAGWDHTCAIRADRTAVCWSDHPYGDFEEGQANNWGQVDAPGGEFTAISAGYRHSCAVRADRTAVCWGRNLEGRTDAPGGEFTAISAGYGHSCAVRADRTAVCWGSNVWGEADAPGGEFTAISAGTHLSCAVRADRTAVCWGSGAEVLPPGVSWVAEEEEELLSVEVSSESQPTVRVGGSFEVSVRFDRPVSGFEAADFIVANGDVTHLSGSGSQYKATVTAAAPGTIVVLIPRAAALSQNGRSNMPSQPLTRTAGTAAGDGEFFDTWDRGGVRSSAFAEYHRQEPEHGWTGDLDSCVAGTTSQQFRDSVIQRVNWYRQMAGVKPVVENPEYSNLAQHAALIMAAEGDLSHFPSPEWACYTQIGADGASSNLGLGDLGLRGINSFIADRGPGNESVGHRRWILRPQSDEFGYGAISFDRAADALYVVDIDGSGVGNGTREQREFVAWPPPGYLPHFANFVRWSFQLAWADFDDASVAMASNNGSLPVELEIIARESGVPTAAVVWVFSDPNADESSPSRWPRGDQCYRVTISGARIGGAVQTPYEYVTCEIDHWTD